MSTSQAFSGPGRVLGSGSLTMTVPNPPSQATHQSAPTEPSLFQASDALTGNVRHRDIGGTNKAGNTSRMDIGGPALLETCVARKKIEGGRDVEVFVRAQDVDSLLEENDIDAKGDLTVLVRGGAPQIAAPQIIPLHPLQGITAEILQFMPAPALLGMLQQYIQTAPTHAYAKIPAENFEAMGEALLRSMLTGVLPVQ